MRKIPLTGVGAARIELRNIGMRIDKISGEYRVMPLGTTLINNGILNKKPIDLAYYTDDISDAISTGRAMVNEYKGNKEKQGRVSRFRVIWHES